MIEEAVHLTDEDPLIEDFLMEYDRVRDALGAHVDAARRELDKARDGHDLMVHPDGWDEVDEHVGDFAREYLPDERLPKRFQVNALSALFEGRDVLLAVPCGAGKTCPPVVFAAQRAFDEQKHKKTTNNEKT